MDEPSPTGATLGEAACVSSPLGPYDLGDAALVAKAVARAAEVGARTVRLDLRWSLVEQAKGVYAFGAWDAPLAAFAAKGIAAFLIADYGNPLYAPPGADPSDDKVPPADAAPYAAFVAAAANHFGARVAALELWNEENAGFRFWKPKEDAAAYARLAGAARDRCPRGAPGCVLWFGGLFFHGEGPVTPALDYLAAALGADPRVSQLDGFALHPYPLYPPSAPPESGDAGETPIASMLSHYAAIARGPVPITEYGWPSAGDVDEPAQARYLARAALLALQSGAPLACWYDLADDARHGHFPPEGDFGLYHFDDAGADLKPSGKAFRVLSTALGAFAFSRDRSAELGAPTTVHALLLTTAARDAAATALWKESGPAANVDVPLHAGVSATLVDRAGAPLPLASSGGVAHLVLGRDPVYLLER